MSNVSHDTHLLGAYVLGTLDPAEQHHIDAHLADCPQCRTELVELEAVRDMLDEVPPEALLHGPPDADLVLQRTLRQMRTETTTGVRQRRALTVAAAAVALAGALAVGVLAGRGTGPGQPTNGALPAPSATTQAPVPGTRVGTTFDPQTGVRLTASVVPAAGWVRVNAAVNGIPAKENCRLIVVGRHGAQEVAGGWVVSASGAHDGTNLDGSAAVAPDEVIAIKVVNTTGHTFVTLNL
jgi:predicted anti-sigma-YlaC factor YlaD